ncbi:hypothetical protein M0811_14365 [Anaeramoeba ignava]|uniref:Uncharacterized protein n=1 Tax=Anaeramoeba ignava TaxID=1746090 RepID=A0A9Q0LV46_ANAIG|nr:hypothetical protein M0811_14365 [Anaeramoeba ignava]
MGNTNKTEKIFETTKSKILSIFRTKEKKSFFFLINFQHITIPEMKSEKLFIRFKIMLEDFHEKIRFNKKQQNKTKQNKDKFTFSFFFFFSQNTISKIVINEIKIDNLRDVNS